LMGKIDDKFSQKESNKVGARTARLDHTSPQTP
jgi:hypothetical protein